MWGLPDVVDGYSNGPGVITPPPLRPHGCVVPSHV